MIREQITLIDRKLDDDEMAGLMEATDVSVTPYRKILISGSFFLATTYKKPTLAPCIGMFADAIQDEKTGFLYDGTINGLANKLLHVSRFSSEVLKNVGARAWEAHRHNTIEEFSNRFFSALEAD
jgi:hypothetical protein